MRTVKHLAKHLTTAFRAFILSLALWAISPAVWATSTDTVIDVGDSVTADGVDWIYNPSTHEFFVMGDVTITGSTNINRIRVIKVANITLSDANIDVSAIPNACAFSMTGTRVFLTLTGTNVLKSGDSRAGLSQMGMTSYLTSGGTLTIDGTGSLTVVGGAGSAGIGDDTITINSGTINATGGSCNSGIGGAVSINGGTINAIGGGRGAGIGGRVSISGGTVNARGGPSGAGISGGVAIFGNARVTAIGGEGTSETLAQCNRRVSEGDTHSGGGAGIGSGGSYDEKYPREGGFVVIVDDAQVTAVGGSDAQGAGGAGIGSGGSGRSQSPDAAGKIIINTVGKVEATGGKGMVDEKGVHHDGANIGEGGYRGGSGKAVEPNRYARFSYIFVAKAAGGTITPLGGSSAIIDPPEPEQPRVTRSMSEPVYRDGQQRVMVSEGLTLSGGKKVDFNQAKAQYEAKKRGFSTEPGSDGKNGVLVAVPEGTSKTFIFTPDPGNVVASVSVGDRKFGAVSSLTMVGENQTNRDPRENSPTVTVTFMPRPVSSGATINVGDNFTTSGTGWTYNRKAHLFTVTGDVTITGTTTENSIRVASGGAPKNITLADASIEAKGLTCAFDMSGATVFLMLVGTNELRSWACAGLQVPVGAFLTIEGTGSLTAVSRAETGAGIGSDFARYSNMSDNKNFAKGGSITINSGIISAEGGNLSVGIGGGFTGAGGDITINGGTIFAKGSTGIGSSGVGSGNSVPKDDLSGGNITISGGTVTARGSGPVGVGIGGQAGSNIVISGGTVSATGERSAGISTGDGEGKKVGSITITGDANVTASGGDGYPVYIPFTYSGPEIAYAGAHAGIGSPGTDSNTPIPVGKITINTTGTVKATGGSGVSKLGFHHDGANIGQGGFNLGSGRAVKPDKSVTTHSVTVTQTSGGVIAPLGGAANAVPHGANKTFTITPEPGYVIASVTVDGADVGAARSWTLVNVADDKRAITATFVPKTAPSESAER